ncbi:hypothetical protein M405DRAFT_865664 [Rhizopogon salebrosus TDB-379]|nr:hypothetical protein M405DRAFT_865664 [Rhizopogon salebrosus TDB-379]
MVSESRRKAIAVTFHGVAIACTALRLSYRYNVSRLGWEDMWAAVSMVSELVCFACALLERPPEADGTTPAVNETVFWLVAIAFPCVLWFARASVLCSLMRVANPEGGLRYVIHGIGTSFGIMWIGLVAQKIYFCRYYACGIPDSVAISQLIADIFSDVMLMILPPLLFCHVQLPRNRKILVLLSFSAALFITPVTILHSALLFGPASTGNIVVGHVKVAISLIVCDLPVLATLAYRLCSFEDIDAPDRSEATVFTSIDLEQLGTDYASVWSATETTSTQFKSTEQPTTRATHLERAGT